MAEKVGMVYGENNPTSGAKEVLVEFRKSVAGDMAEIRHVAETAKMNTSLFYALVDLTHKVEYLIYQVEGLDSKMAAKFLILADQLTDDIYKIAVAVDNSQIEDLADAVQKQISKYRYGDQG